MSSTRLLVAVCVGLCSAVATTAAAVGPALETAVTALDRAVRCPVNFSGSREPVLLVHGTGGTPEDHWALDYEKFLPEHGFDVCTVRLPDYAWGDMQSATEYVVHAIRTIAARSGRPVDVVGGSQGGLEPRWAVKWWPDVLASLDDLVTLGTPHHGAAQADAACTPGSCDAALWQANSDSEFLEALNADDETPGSADYTSIYSLTDEVVQPVGTQSLDGAANVLVQDVCPGRPVSHIAHVFDAVVFALVIDALTNPGPAVPARIDPGVCQDDFLPGVTAEAAACIEAHASATAGESGASHEDVAAEPPLRSYALPEPSAGPGCAAAIALLHVLARRRNRSAALVRASCRAD